MGGGRLGQLGPYFLPVVRAQVLAGDGAVGCYLDGDAALKRHGLVAADHFGHE